MREFIRRWTLAISMMAGASSYFILSWLPLGGGMRRWLLQGVGVVQPVLIFLMLFLTFCRVNPAQMRLCRWQMWNLLLQAGMRRPISRGKKKTRRRKSRSEQKME